MGTEKRKQALFSVDQFIIMVAWLATILGILYYEAFEFVLPAIAAFVVLNVAIWVWVHRFRKPIEDKGYKPYLTVQTVFLVFWCPLLAVIFSMGRTDLVSLWAIVLVGFYLAIGMQSIQKMIAK